MSTTELIGEITVKDVHEVEWTIGDFLSYTTEDEHYNSPYFTLSGIEWYLKIFPNEQIQSEGCISLSLHRRCDGRTSQGTTYSLGVKKADGTVLNCGYSVCWVFESTKECRGVTLPRSVFLELSNELVPSNDLTVTCTLWMNESVDCPTRLSAKLTDLLNSKQSHDVILKVKDKTFFAHKLILSVQSSVFEDMFNTNWNWNWISPPEFTIEDCDPKTFKDFLLYLYSGRFSKLSASPFKLYRIADKYKVEDLMSDCLISVVSNLSVENFCDSAVFGEKVNDSGVEARCKQFFNEHSSEILINPKWEKFMKENNTLALELLKDKATKDVKLKK